MKSAEDIESFLIQMDAHYESVGDDIWVVTDLGPEMVVSIAGPVVVFRIKVLELEKVPADKREALYSKLLELNATEMMHGAYGLEQGAVVVTDALQLEHLDFSEFQATMDDIGMALTNHYRTLSALSA